MSPRIWSDEDRLFIPRLGGWTLNFKYIARKFGWVKPSTPAVAAPAAEAEMPKTGEDRLADAVERSKYENI